MENRRIMGFKGEAYALGVTGGAEAEPREQSPEAAPATREDAGPRGGDGGVELVKDVDQNIVGKRADVVLAAAAIREPGCLGEGLPVAVLHG
jgi:hypothetical protein